MAFAFNDEAESTFSYHRWYLEKFEAYPSDRKVIIPDVLSLEGEKKLKITNGVVLRDVPFF